MLCSIADHGRQANLGGGSIAASPGNGDHHLPQARVASVRVGDLDRLLPAWQIGDRRARRELVIGDAAEAATPHVLDRVLGDRGR